MLLRARIEPREAVATVGSGDAFLAGFVAARYGGRSPEDCLRFGVACGAESIQRLGAGLHRAARGRAARAARSRSRASPRPPASERFLAKCGKERASPLLP